MVALSVLPLLLATAALAAPSRRGFRGDCNVPLSDIHLPPSFDSLSSSPNFFLLGVGVQNYICNSQGTFDSIGATAQLFEVSCLSQLSDPSVFSTIQNAAFKDWNTSPTLTDPLGPGLVQLMKDRHNINVEGQHYFVLQNGALVPVWDLRSSGENAGNPNAIVFAQKIHNVPSHDGPNNVDWVELKKLSGSLANLVYLIETVGGQPPGTCTPGSSTSVKYAGNYMFT